jgi:PKD repeat protein
LSKTALPVLITLAMLAFAPAALAVAPTGTLTITPAAPDRPNVNEAVTFEITGLVWGGTAGTVAWSFGDGDGASGANAQTTHAYATAGTKQVAAIVTNGEGEIAGFGPKPVQVNTPPVVVFNGFLPIAPVPGVDVLFASDSSDPDGDALTHSWSFGDGSTSPNRNATHAFADAGMKTVTLTVTDPFGASDTKTEQVPVLSPRPPDDKPPKARFVFSPKTPQVGDPVDIVSTSVDLEDQLRSQAWDLDGDGEFDDGRGDEVLHTFTSDGQKTVRLRVEDAAGNSAEEEHLIKVDKRPPAPAGYMRPPPSFNIGGLILSNGMQVQSLIVRAPKGALITVSCRGKSCGVKQRRKRGKGSALHFKTYERFLRAGVRLEIFVRKSGTIGTYRRYTIRAGKGPAHLDRCLKPGKTRPSRCS